MKFIEKAFITRLWMVFLLAGLSMVTVSAVASALQIGDKYGGGKIAWIDASGNHGLIAAKADLPGYYTWDEAKKACDDVVKDCSSDWYLPSKDDLNKLYLAKSAVGGFVDYYYWSSTEINAVTAWYKVFGGTLQAYFSKGSKGRVRPVRVF